MAERGGGVRTGGAGAGAGAGPAGGGRTPLSARWQQMSQQEQLIQHKKEMLMQKNKDKNEAKSFNIFTNDGSFLEKFKMMKDVEKKTNPAKSSTQDDSKKQSEPRNNQKQTDRHRRRSRSHSSTDSSESRSRSRSKSRDRNRNRQDRWKRNERSRDRHKSRWESSGRHSRQRSNSPSTPAVEDMIQRRQSRFSSVPASNSSVPLNPVNVMVNPNLPPESYMQSNPPPNFQQGLPPMMPNVGPMQSIGIPPGMPMPSMMNIPNGPVPPPMNIPSGGPVPHMMNIQPGGPMQPQMNIPPGGPMQPQMNIPPGGPMQPQMNIPPGGPMQPQMNIPPGGPVPSLMNIPSGSVAPFNVPSLQMNVPPGGPVPSLNVPPPSIRQNYNMPNYSNTPPLSMGMQPDRFNHPNFNTPPPGFGDNSFYPSMPPNLGMIPPPTTMPLHTIPEPKPLEAMKIPPPKPMNLQSIPPPSPLCINQIPKPKELDLLSIPPPTSIVLSTDDRRCGATPAMDGLAKQVAHSGDELELVLKQQSSHDSSTWFLNDPQCPEYKLYRDLVESYRSEIEQAKKGSQVRPEDKYEPEFSLQDDSDYEDNKKPDADQKKSEERVKKRKSRWSDAPADASAVVGIPGVANVTNLGSLVGMPAPLMNAKEIPQLTTRTDPGLLQYAVTNYGSTTLTEEQWKKCEDHYKISSLYQEMMKKRQEIERLAAAGRFKYEYDSDEEVDDHGTWEHKLRMQEMEATKQWANELTRQAQGKHHIGDFLPPDELEKFMHKYSAVKSGKEPDLSDYKEFKLKEDNIGFKMLQKLGWTEGQGLGADGSGIVEPVNKGNQRDTTQGLGIDKSDSIDKEDDEFDAYRKRMMLAYRFRPNPLNNPRRPYY